MQQFSQGFAMSMPCHREIIGRLGCGGSSAQERSARRRRHGSGGTGTWRRETATFIGNEIDARTCPRLSHAVAGACRRMHLAVRPILDCRKRRNARLACCSRLRDSTRLSPSSKLRAGYCKPGADPANSAVLLSFLLDFYSIYDPARQIYRFGTLW